MRGETLTESELSRLKPIRGEGGRSWRAYCPFHGSDQQRSLRVDTESGRFHCFACEAWGYMDWARKYPSGSGLNSVSSTNRPQRSIPGVATSLSKAIAAQSQPGLEEHLKAYEAALADSLGEEYLLERKIPIDLARRHRVGYAAAGKWAHRGERGQAIRDWHFGRLVFPHTGPDNHVVNLYGRALGDAAPKSLRHDHLPGAKAYFNFPALEESEVFLCEGPFDAMSLMAAAPGLAAVAIFGVKGWRHEWCVRPRTITLALDSDSAGQSAWRSLARQLALRGKKVRVLSAEAFGGAKDANEAWMLGTLRL